MGSRRAELGCAIPTTDRITHPITYDSAQILISAEESTQRLLPVKSLIRLYRASIRNPQATTLDFMPADCIREVCSKLPRIQFELSCERAGVPRDAWPEIISTLGLNFLPERTTELDF